VTDGRNDRWTDRTVIGGKHCWAPPSGAFLVACPC